MAKKTKKLQTVDLGRFTAEYVAARREALIEAAGNRNERMQRYEDIYDMKMWLDDAPEGARRVTTSLGFQTVQQMVALQHTRPFTINVPTLGMGAQANNRAQKKEKYLYGMTDMANIRPAVRDAAWSAADRGLGVLRLYYKARRFADEFPLKIDAPDPKTLYYTMSSDRARFTEVAHTWKRKRREVESEWGATLNRPEGGFEDQAMEQDWLDGECDYTEYWAEEAAEEKREKETPESQDAGRMKGVMELVKPPLTLPSPGLPGEGAGMPGMAMPAGMGMMGAGEPGSGAEYSAEGEGENGGEAQAEGAGNGVESETKAPPKSAKTEIVLVRKVVHTVIVEDGSAGEAQVVKKAVVLPGYTRIPFFFWSAVRTPRNNNLGSLSVLYALTNGDAEPGKGGLGVLQTINELLSLDVTIATKFANPVAMTDDDELNPDLNPGAVNQTKPNRKGLWYVENPGSIPDVARLTQQMRDEASRVSIPEVLSGQYVSASGQALGIMSSVFEQTLGFAQADAEQALGAMYSQALELTEYYADPDYGWKVWGAWQRKDFEDWIKPEDIDGDYRVRVKLSANLPRDIVAMLSLYARLAGGKTPLISHDTFLDLFQKLTDAGADTPLEEMSKILGEMGLFQGPLAQMLAESLGKEYAPLLNVPIPPAAPPSPQPSPMPSPQPSPGLPGEGGMAGMPVNPQTVAAMGNMQGAMNMPGGPGLAG